MFPQAFRGKEGTYSYVIELQSKFDNARRVGRKEECCAEAVEGWLSWMEATRSVSISTRRRASRQ